ncbi:MAG: ribosomal RNA small subunit methyltransferase A [Candidatus Binatia bacterium]|nr:MAG: ribosomal RNA small subunit methyltransferase A [Candidatus Binatia bacterium]
MRTRRHRPRLGQHFLADRVLARRIAELALEEPSEFYVEVGPGLGALTEHLVPRVPRILLLEIDPSLVRALRDRYGSMPHVEVREADASEFDWKSSTASVSSVTVVGNLPYRVGTRIVTDVLGQVDKLRTAVFMLQREVAERLVAEPGSRDYGSLSVLARLRHDLRIALRVRPGAFRPPPKVHSAVVVARRLSRPRVEVPDVAAFEGLVRALFRGRRKQLRNVASSIWQDAEAVLRRAGIDPSRRAETLSLEEFARLAHLGRHARAARS